MESHKCDRFALFFVWHKKKLIVSRQPILVNLKSNTMKNTMQNYSVLK